MKTDTLDTLIWTFVYGGLLVLSLSLFVSPSSTALGMALAVAGGLGSAVGVVLFYARTRLKDSSR